MKILLVSGGYGTRFWPVSRKKNPKQHQKVVSKDKTLLQMKYSYLTPSFSPNDIFIITGIDFAKEVKKQLPKLPPKNIIYEPAMRDTAAAVGLGLLRIKRLFPNEVVSLQWCDHLIRRPDIFRKALIEGEKIAVLENKEVVLAIPPRFPTPHLGYIKAGKPLKKLDSDGEITLLNFKRFVEKPTAEKARKYLKSGKYCWNPGYFIVHPNRVLKKYENFAPNLYKNLVISEGLLYKDPENIKAGKIYGKFEKVAFDYIYAENLVPAEAVILRSEMGWSDVGEWSSLKEALQKNPNENVVSGKIVTVDCENNMIYNLENKKLLAAIDLSGFVVVNTPEAILVCPQESVGKIKKMLKSFSGTPLEKYT